jgi:hypothetical protein
MRSLSYAYSKYVLRSQKIFSGSCLDMDLNRYVYEIGIEK